MSNHDSWTALDHCIPWGSPHSCNPHKRSCMNDAFFFTCVKYTLSSIKTICDEYLLRIFYRYNQSPLIRTLQVGVGEHRKCRYYWRGVIYKERWSIWSTCHKHGTKKKIWVPVHRLDALSTELWGTEGLVASWAIKKVHLWHASCLLLGSAINVEIIMSLDVLIKRVEFRENVRASDVRNCP